MTARRKNASDTHSILSDIAVAKLRSSGIEPAVALGAGIYSVEDARAQVHPEFATGPALVFQYYDVAGDPIFFTRDGELLQFVRVRYLGDPPVTGFAKRAPQRYAQLRGSGVHAYFPRVSGIDWAKIASDPAINLVITEGELKALSLCARDIAAIGLGGVDCFVQKQEQVS